MRIEVEALRLKISLTIQILAERGETKKFEDHALEQLQSLGFSSESDPCYLQAFEISSLEYVREKTDLKLVFLLEQNITEEVWTRLDGLNLAGIGVDKGGLVTPGHKDDEGRGSVQWGEPTQFLETVQSCAEGLQFSIKSLSFEPPGSEAAHYYRLAQNAYSQVKDLLEITKLVKLK